MKSTRRRALYILAALLGALFVLSCLVGFAACGGGSNDENDATVSTVSISGATSVEEGKTVTLTASVTMSDNSSYTGSYTWSSTGTAVTLSSSTTSTVTVTGVTAGSSDITVTAGGVTSAKCTVTVTAAQQQQPTVESVSITPTSTSLNLYESKTAALTATVTMSEGSYSGDYTWSSSDTNVATVEADSSDNSKATVSAVAAGNTTITVSAGGKEATCSVTVTADTVKTEAGLSNVFSKGGSVSLTDNITLADSSSALEVKADTTIDLAGKTISAGSSWTLPTDDQSGFRSDALITVDAGATLTVTDSTASGTTGGSISYDVTGSTIVNPSKSDGSTYAWNSSVNYGAAIEVEEGGALVIESGTIESSSVGVRAEGVDSSSSETRASVTISGGTISSTYYSIWASGDADVTIEEGATVTSTDKGICIGGDSNFGYSSYQYNTKTTLTITGGEVSCTNDSAICTLGIGSNDSAEITISGGTISNSASVTGEGTSITAPPAVYVPSGTLTITGGTITSTLTAVEIRGGTATISGGTLITTYSGEEPGDGATQETFGAKTYGYALSVYAYGVSTGMNNRLNNSSDNYTNGVNVTVSGGTFEGDIYVAAEAEYSVNNEAKWQVKLNDSSATTTDKYVVSINFTDTTITAKTVAYDSTGTVIEDTTEGGDQGGSGDTQTVSYYIITVSAVSTGSGN